MTKPEAQSNQRIRYYDGQLLASKDLRDDRAYTDWSRGLHIRVLHDTWGIALGLNVVAAANSSQLLITPGLAYDCWGRELLLSETLELPMPIDLSAAGLILAIRYSKNLGVDRQAISSDCAPSNGLDSTLERPTFLWQQPEQLRLGEDIPLAHVRLQDSIDLGVRRNAQPLQRPHIGWGTYEVTFPLGPEQPPHSWDGGFRFDIDTSEAGFIQTPYYFAALQSLQVFNSTDPIVEPLLDLSFKAVINTQPNQLTFQYLFLPEARNRWELLARSGASIQFKIFWTGIESVAGCEPIPDQQRAFTWGGTRLLDWQTKWLPQLITSLGNSASILGGEE